MTLWTPEFIQPLKYPAQRLRLLNDASVIQEGVVSLWQDAAINPLLVDVTTPNTLAVKVNPGAAYVRGDTFNRQGLYHVVNDAEVTLNIPPNSSGLPRVDMIVISVKDSVDASDPDDTPLLQVIPGTPTTGAHQNNELGIAALPPTSILLATVYVPSGAATIPEYSGPSVGFADTTSIVDRRRWGHGAQYRRFATGWTQSVNTTAGPTGTHIYSFHVTHYDPFIEVGELGRRLRFRADLYATFTSAATLALVPNIAPAVGRQPGTTVVGPERRMQSVGSGQNLPISLECEFTVTPGRYQAWLEHRLTTGSNGAVTINPASLAIVEVLGSSDRDTAS